MPDPCPLGQASDSLINQMSQNTPGPVAVTACEFARERGAELADHTVDGVGGDINWPVQG